jgi:4-hydroxybenzoate polyprenyltransferase
MKSKKLKISSLQFLKLYGIQMRPYLLFVSGIAGATGMVMTGTIDKPSWHLLLVFLPFFQGYGFGQALTDCFQTDTDKLSAPYRPLSKGLISIKQTLIVSIVGLGLCALIFFFMSYISFLLALLTVFGLATYTYFKKNYWFIGPFYNAWIVALLPVMGYFAISSSGFWGFPRSLYPFILITFLSYSNFVLIGYLKDIEADRETGYKTFPVLFGWQKTLWIGNVIWAITLILFWAIEGKNFPEISAGILFTLIVVIGQFKGHVSKTTEPESATFSIVSTLRGFILIHMALILHFLPDWWIGLLGYYLLFETALFFRPSASQV